MIQCRCSFSDAGGVAIANVKNQAPKASIFGFSGKGAQGCHCFEVINRAAGGWGFIKVIPGGNPIDFFVEFSPERPQSIHRHVLLADMYAQFQGHL